MIKLIKEIDRVLRIEDLTEVQEGMLIALKEEFTIKLKHDFEKDSNLFLAHKMAKSIKNIHLGCGNHLIKGFINIDINNECDIFWDIRKNLPFLDESIEKIFSEHFFEHLDYPISVNKVLSESFRVLKTGGEFIVGVPDCSLPLEDVYDNINNNMKIAKEKWYLNRTDILENMNTNLDYLNYVMRDQLFHKKYHPHYWGYNKENLSFLLKKHGFVDIKIWEPDYMMINPKRKWGTLYITCKKM